MKGRIVTLWTIGPVGAGKSTFLRNNLPAGFQIVDQDRHLEELLVERGIPLDTTGQDQTQLAEFARIRAAIAAQVWAEVPALRKQGIPCAIETTGDKPHLLAAEVELDRVAGRRSLGIGLRTPLEVCHARNRQRRRVLADEVVLHTWQAFERHLADGTYASILGTEGFRVVEDSAPLDLAGWIARHA